MTNNNHRLIKSKKGNAFSYFENKNHRLIKSKKAETIGTTWDMIFGFFIIMFFLVIFLTLSFFMAEKKVWTGSSEVSLTSYEDNLRSQSMLFSLMNSPINFDDKEGKVKDVLASIEFYSLDSAKKIELRDLLKSQVQKLIGNNTNKCYIFQAIYGISDNNKLTNVDPRGAQYASEYLEKNTLEFTSTINNVDPRATSYVNQQKSKWLDKSANIILVRDTTMNLFGVDTGEKQKIYVKFYNGECLG